VGIALRCSARPGLVSRLPFGVRLGRRFVVAVEDQRAAVVFGDACDRQRSKVLALDAPERISAVRGCLRASVDAVVARLLRRGWLGGTGGHLARV
jgi:hypothetical protein